MPRGGQTDGVESGRSDAARRCRRRLRIFFLLQGLDHRDRSGDAPVVAAVGRRRETHREEDLDLSVCLATRGEAEVTHIALPPHSPWDQLFVGEVHQSISLSLRCRSITLDPFSVREG